MAGAVPATARSSATAPGSREAGLEADLVRLASADRNGLARRWRLLFGRTAPDLPNTLLHRILAYRVQADALGDLEPATIKRFGQLGRGEIDAIPRPDPRGTKPGTLLVREWDGTLQRVMVLDKGFAWNGATFDSLSAVARAITGTNWNGPRFFGLRDKDQPDARKPRAREVGAVTAERNNAGVPRTRAAQPREVTLGGYPSIAGPTP